MGHLSYIYPQVLLVIGSVTNRQSQLILLTGLIQLHLLEQEEQFFKLQASDSRGRGGGGQLELGSHLVFQLILSVHLMLSDIKVVGGVVVDGLRRKPATDEIFR